PGSAAADVPEAVKQQTQHYPALDIVADNFELGKKKLGKLEVQASEQTGNWSIKKLRISNPDSVLSGDGEWRNWRHHPNTRMNLSWDISDIGNTLGRFGYPGIIKNGKGKLSGQLRWRGSPQEFEIPGLAGKLKLEAKDGQILQIKPGVGRLFSVLSLQNLPRRLTFDFTDVFSRGFTFDTITANVKIDDGVMHSDDFRMEGPVALVQIKGQADLAKETQHLFVKVTPYISDSVSLAALAGGPVVGAAAFIAQKLLKDPLNKIAASEYEITGTWEDPTVIKGDKKEAAPEAPSPLSDDVNK
ncbi:MAG TPA: AsmA-like C-terminal region-containing protein, partial [Methylophilaceae bacterium]|nr:AsmA-like C-terminal region-containing protein [Methylophilaceae bacterium]